MKFIASKFKVCNKCGKEKHRLQFSRQPSGKLGDRCVSCSTESSGYVSNGRRFKYCCDCPNTFEVPLRVHGRSPARCPICRKKRELERQRICYHGGERIQPKTYAGGRKLETEHEMSHAELEAALPEKLSFSDATSIILEWMRL